MCQGLNVPQQGASWLFRDQTSVPSLGLGPCCRADWDIAQATPACFLLSVPATFQSSVDVSLPLWSGCHAARPLSSRGPAVSVSILEVHSDTERCVLCCHCTVQPTQNARKVSDSDGATKEKEAARRLSLPNPGECNKRA